MNKPYLTFTGISNEQFVSVMNRLHGSEIAENCQAIMDTFIVESQIVCLEPTCILAELELFTYEQIANICNHMKDVFSLPIGEWYVFTLS